MKDVQVFNMLRQCGEALGIGREVAAASLLLPEAAVAVLGEATAALGGAGGVPRHCRGLWGGCGA